MLIPGVDPYSIFRKRCFAPDSGWAAGEQWDFFLSAYNASERVRTVYSQARADKKYWVIHPEYRLIGDALPPEPKFEPSANGEDEFVIDLVNQLILNGYDPQSSSLCIDITGMLRPHLLFLVRALQKQGVSRFDALYSEPAYYRQKAATAFSAGMFSGVRQVAGYEGISNIDTSSDLLIIGMGFDAQQTKEVAEDKDKAHKIQLFGLPSLRADMYQQSVLRSREVADWLGDPSFAPANRAAAPANDPFVTANILSELVAEREARHPPTNIYLSPLGTKAQALGFALFYIGECVGKNRSIIFPFSTEYSPKTTKGLSRIWLYGIEFPIFP